MKILLLLSIIFSLTGCGVTKVFYIDLDHAELIKPVNTYTEEIIVVSPALDLRSDKERIGEMTTTAFLINIVDFKTTSPVEEQIVTQVVKAISAIGYKTNTTEADPLQLRTTINKIWFRNHGWFMLTVPTWGDISITLTLEDSSGNIIFEKTYEGEGSSYNFNEDMGFPAATRKATTEILNKIIADFSSEAVHTLIIQSQRKY